MKRSKAFDHLKEVSTEVQTYGSILSLLHWDQETYMPSGAISPRSQQIAQLSSLIHEQKTGPRFKNALEKLISLSTGKLKAKGLSLPQKAAVREWHRDFSRAHKLPASFVKQFAQITSEAGPIWAMAKASNNFKLFAPFLTKIIELSRKRADILGFSEHPYDALLESYEPCMTTHRVGVMFGRLKKELTTLLKKLQMTKGVDCRFLHKAVSDEKQLEIGKILLSKLPMDMGYTRLDLSSHPFSTALHPHDSRITTRLVPKAFMSNLFSILHESGHSFYEMGLPVEHWGTPLSEATSLSIHESQSRWWETLIGRSLPFWKFFYPTLQKTLPALKEVPLSRFYRAIHTVEPTFIRVEADEVTYCLHVILRFEIEKQLIEGTLPASELPDAWNHKMRELLGITPPTDREGCLQDIHWALGDFGYFPTYALGNLFAAHFFAAFQKSHANWGKRVAAGDLTFVREWLRENIHRFGKMYNSDELALKVTGKPLSETAYCTYLKDKYSLI